MSGRNKNNIKVVEKKVWRKEDKKGRIERERMCNM